MSDLKLAIFDFDGTLVDSRRNIQVAMARAFEAAGLEAPPYEATRQIVGLGLEEACGRLAPNADPGTLEKIINYYRNAFGLMRQEPGHSEPLYDGALDLLGRLQRDGWLIAGATGKSRRGVQSVLQLHDLHETFAIVRCADDGPGKPHPFMAAACLAELGVDSRDAVMIGDTSFDMIMARAANVAAFGVTWGFHTPDEILAGGAHLLFDDFSALAVALDRFGETRSIEGAA